MRAEQPALEADLDRGADDSDLDLEPAVLGADAVVGAGEGDRPARVDLPRHRDRARVTGLFGVDCRRFAAARSFSTACRRAWVATSAPRCWRWTSAPSQTTTTVSPASHRPARYVAPANDTRPLPPR